MMIEWTTSNGATGTKFFAIDRASPYGISFISYQNIIQAKSPAKTVCCYDINCIIECIFRCI